VSANRTSRAAARLVLALLAALAAAGAGIAPANAQGTEAQHPDRGASSAPGGDQLQQVERALEQDRARVAALAQQRAALAREIAEMQERLVAAGKRAQELEAGLDEIDGTLAALEENLDVKEAELEGRRRQLDASLAALGWLALQPPAALLIGAERPLDRLRGALLLGSAIPALQKRAADLAGSLAELKRLKGEIAERKSALEAESGKLAAENAEIAKLVEERRALEARAGAEQSAAAARAERLAAQADDLRDLLRRLEALRPPLKPDGPAGGAGRVPAALQAPAGLRAFPDPPASIAMPVTGTIQAGFGDPAEAGGRSRGVTFRTRPGAQVVAPFDGQVVFQGPFRGYGAILIIEHAGGYHTLLAGLGRIDVAAGQWIKEGEPIGQMGPAVNGGPKLYVELRRGGQPIDPTPWLGIRDN
jgi:septal ring factor EnvC (AmiA/AmiB activator)